MGDTPVVLVVEDEWLLRDCIAAHLRAARWQLLEACSGEAAIALLNAGMHIDVVVTDGWRWPAGCTTLQIVLRKVNNVYVQQSVMRRTVWSWHSAKAG